jgi:hypothetical protein
MPMAVLHDCHQVTGKGQQVGIPETDEGPKSCTYPELSNTNRSTNYSTSKNAQQTERPGDFLFSWPLKKSY